LGYHFTQGEKIEDRKTESRFLLHVQRLTCPEVDLGRQTLETENRFGRTTTF
jgi:hypothetical protein